MKTNRSSQKLIFLFSVLLISSLMLTACAGSGSAELESDAEAQVEVSEPEQDSVAVGQAEDDSATETEAESETEGEAGAEADVEAAASVPVIVPGSPEMHGTDPSSVTLASGQVQFVEFFAYWCTVCKAMAPSVHGLEAAYSDRVNFVYLDRDDPATEELRNQLGYFYQPHIFILDAEGNILYNRSGYVEVAELQTALEAALQ